MQLSSLEPQMVISTTSSKNYSLMNANSKPRAPNNNSILEQNILKVFITGSRGVGKSTVIQELTHRDLSAYDTDSIEGAIALIHNLPLILL